MNPSHRIDDKQLHIFSFLKSLELVKRMLKEEKIHKGKSD